MSKSSPAAYSRGTDSARRVTVTDSQILSTSKLLVTILRPNTAEADDEGFRYEANVVNLANGSFDLVIQALDADGDDAVLDPPAETVTIVYHIL